ncbi:hypothetical protein UT300013_23400 [Paraclostridium sordellii]
MKLKTALLAIIILAFGLWPVNSYAQKSTDINIQYRSHVQDEGWQSWKKNGEISGTTGQEKRVEAIEIKADNLPQGVNLIYRTHVQDEGWQGWKKNGEQSGTTGQGKRIEAVEIKLENTQGYDIQYRTHVQDQGWQDWKKNGELSGTTGQAKRVEAIEIKLESVQPPNIVYQAHVQDQGWQGWKKNGEVAGTTGQEKRIEAIKLNLEENNLGGNLIYRTHVQDQGWQDWKKNGAQSGTTGQGKRIEAIEIKLENIPGYDIQYRVHVQDEGWQGWKKNGEISGTTGQGKRVEAIEVNIVKEGYTPPLDPEYPAKIMYTTADRLNVRSGPGTNYNTVGTLPKGSKVEVVEEINGWAKIKFNYGYGYVSARYLSENSEENIKIMYTTADRLNVRSGPGTNYNTVGTLPKGSKVEVVEEINGWAKIKFNNGYAYVNIGYLTQNPNIGSGQQPLPIPTPIPSYVDAPQNPNVIDPAQDIYQNKINVTKGNTNGLSKLSISTNGEFKINYQFYSNGKWKYGENGSEVNSEGLSVEGVRINIEKAPDDYHIFYRAKIENQGWQAWVKDGSISGELGNGNKIEDLEVRVIISNNSESMIKPTIAIDTGHNVSLSGASNGIYSENYLTKTIGEKTIYKLRSMGYNVIDTLPKGEYTQSQELAKRTEVAKLNEVDKFVSIHFNSGPEGANGSEVYYSQDYGSSTMASNVLKNIVNDFGFRNRGIKDGDHLYVLRNTNMPAILVEGCFLDNIDMNKFIAKGSSAYDIMADGIIRGII